MKGSSPLSRGIRRRAAHTCHCTGIIPALAGNTCGFRGWRWRGQDHPRSRGEYAGGEGREGGELGSSPLSRGIPATRHTTPQRPRIIPALAGNTPWNGTPSPPCRDHPRSRGEYYSPATRTIHLDGSSPLSRGIQEPAFPPELLLGSSPLSRGIPDPAA